MAPIIKVNLLPNKILETISLPNSSVPKIKSKLGARNLLPTPILVGEKGAIKSANPADNISIKTIDKPIKPFEVDNNLLKNE